MKQGAFRRSFVILAAFFLTGGPTLRAEVLATLDEHALREALALSRGPAERVADFLRTYRQPLAAQASMPYLSEVEVVTPFRLVVERALTNPESYDFSQARADYRPKDDRLGFEVTIRLPPAYFYNSATPFGTDWVIRPRQKGKLLKFVDRSYKTLHTGGFMGSDSTLIGAQVRMNYDIHEADLAAPVTVEIISPDGRRTVTEFHLADLR